MKGTMLRKGFTLLELLMVVIIIGILAAIALPQYIRVTEKARGTEALQILGSLRSAQQRYRAQTGGVAFAIAINDLDVEAPLATRSWGTPPPLVLTANSGSLARAGGPLDTKTLGITWELGNICGTFDAVTGTAAAACP